MKTNAFKKIAVVLCAFASAGTMMAQDLWQWDFNQGNLTATVGSNDLQYADGPAGATAAGTVFGSTSTLGIPPINGTNANVMKFPISGQNMGYEMLAPMNPNGGSPDLVNDYTIIMDILIPTNSVGRVCPLVQTDGGEITPGADLVIDSSGGIGAPDGPYSGMIQPNVWYRIAFAVTASEIFEYINGVEVGEQATGGTDSQWALQPNAFVQLFQNSTTNGAAIGYVSSIQLQDVALNAGQIAALGGASAAKISTNTVSNASYVDSKNPAPSAANQTPQPSYSVVIEPGGTTINPSSISFNVNGSPIQATVTYTGSNYLVTATTTNLLLPLSIDTASVVYSDSAVGLQTNSWSFSVFKYQNINLPTPIYFESFEQVPIVPFNDVVAVPNGWSVTNWTDVLDGTTNIDDTQSDSYLNWVVVDVMDYTNTYTDTSSYTSPGFPNVSGNSRLMIPPIVENGKLLTSLVDGTNLVVAESDQRDGNQVNVMFTTNYNFVNYSNVYVAFNNLYEQNQDNIGSVEYSIDNGATWQPLLYMLDDGTTDNNGSDVVTNPVTGQIDVDATFNTERADQAHGLSYGTFIGAAITTNLIPYIRPCRNDDPVQQKRIELFRLPLADGQPKVSLRFMQAGTGSWFFDIDALGFYTIPQAIILQQPGAVSADYNSPATFSVQAGGNNLTYQWKINGTNIVDATNANYTIVNATTNSLGLYSVGVTNNYGGITSIQVPLTLVETPVILSAPVDQTISLYGTAQFAVQARGGQPLSYQWLYNSNAIAGATNTTYTITNAQTGNSGSYQVAVSNNFSVVISPVANLDVFAGSITQAMLVHLTFDNTYADATGNGNNATNIGNPTFEPGFLGEAIHVISSGSPANAPATNNYVTLNYPSDLQFGSEINGGTATDFSVSFWTKIFYQNDDKPFIANKDWNSGGNPGWDINTEGGGMKWNYDDNANSAPGVDTSRRDSPTVAPQLEDGGWHHVVVTMARNSLGTIYVDGVMVNQTSLAPGSSTNIIGSVDTTGLGWSINIGQDGTGTYTDNSGGAAADMLIDDLAIWGRVVTSAEDLGIFNAGLHSNTVDQSSTVTPGAAPMITLQPKPASAGAGASATLLASVLGTPNLAYQWYFGATLLAGQTNTSYAITNMQANLQGNYSLVITNSFGAVTSQLAAVTFTGVLPPSITSQPVSELVTPGTPVTFAVVATGSTNLTYQWYEGAGSITGATNASYAIASALPGNQGSYYVVVGNGTSSTNSASALLDVYTGSLNNGLMAYLPFDGDYRDYSGHANNGTPIGSPTFAPGRVGQALHFTTTNDDSVINYVSLGYPADLQFGTNDFTVGLWVNCTNHGDDPSFIANKNWGSSGNVGWGIFSQGGNDFRVNAQGTGGTKMDTTATPGVYDGNWHFILCTFWRSGQYTSTYVDGRLYTTSPLTFIGSVDTDYPIYGTNALGTNGLAINIGQDGTGSYTDGNSSSLHIDGLIDEVTLWNRAVTAAEVAELYSAGTNNLTPFTFIQNATRSNNVVTLNWRGGVPPFTVGYKTNLTDAAWTQSASTTNQTMTVTNGSGTGFFQIQGAN